MSTPLSNAYRDNFRSGAFSGFCYSDSHQQWSSIAHGRAAAARLKIVTWNVWFSPFESSYRWNNLLRIVHDEDADVIAFQEATQEFVNLLMSLDWVRQTYRCSDFSGNPTWYGTFMLVRRSLPFVGFSWIDGHHSNQGRRFLMGEFFAPSPPLSVVDLMPETQRQQVPTDAGIDCPTDSHSRRMAVVCVHLESCSENRELRTSQLRGVMGHLKSNGVPHAIVCGDCNFDPAYPEQAVIDESPFVDAWPTLHSGPGLSEDTDINRMRWEHHGRTEKKARYDRALVHSDMWQWARCGLLGVEELKDGVWPSDHYGLTTTLACGLNGHLWTKPPGEE